MICTKGLKPIETFTGGELIWTRDDITLEYGYRPVIATKATPDQPIFQVMVKNHQGQTETLHTTAEHPFWIKDTGWLKASLLEQGMILLDRNNQEVEVLSQFLIPNHTDTVYNIEVDDFHTYHVGRLGVWVHNADCCEVNQGSGKKPATNDDVKANLDSDKKSESKQDQNQLENIDSSQNDSILGSITQTAPNWKSLSRDRQQYVNGYMTQFGNGSEGAKKLLEHIEKHGVGYIQDKEAFISYYQQITQVGGNKPITSQSEVFKTRLKILKLVLK